MAIFRVSVAVRVLEVYEVEAESAADAADNWCWGELIHHSDEALDTEVLRVKEAV